MQEDIRELGLDDLPFEFPDEDIDHPPIVDNAMQSPRQAEAPAPDMRPAAQRLETLFAHMPGSRYVLFWIIDAASKGIAETSMEAVVASLQEHRASVYSAHSLCTFLEEGGALERVTEDGTPYDEAECAPQKVVEDGVEYIVPGRPPQLFWKTTADGAAFRATDDPAAEVAYMVAADATYAPVIKHIMNRAARGVDGKALAAELDNLELMKEPRMYATTFLKRLEDSGVITWTGEWRLTEAGTKALAAIEHVPALETVMDTEKGAE